MKLFECQVCRQALYFENVACERCHRRLGYIAWDKRLAAFEMDGGGYDLWHVAGEPESRYRFCSNARYDVCNWVIDADQTERFCGACRHNHVIPDLSRPENQKLWRMMEFAKHRLFYSLIDLHLPLVTREEDPREGLMFEFLEDTLANKRVVTGHIAGKITINIAEADDAERERRRSALREPYRTLLGHFRHEIGHWYWDRMVRDAPALEAFRIVFGDEQPSYRSALRQHYAQGAPSDWALRSVSAYATSHPWEDFAETFAHYLHIVDALDTANEFGIGIHPRHLKDAAALTAEIDFEPQHARSIKPLVEAWLPLTFAVNSLNRSMGQTDFYPFVLSPTVVNKLGFVHDLVHRRVGQVPLAQEPMDTDANLPIDNAAVDRGPFAEHPSR
jgi:hypothetical protein